MEEKNNITYKTCGIDDVEAFYKEKFAHNVSYDIQNANLYEYNILNLKQIYVYDYIKPNAVILDFGCGSGVFKILKTLGSYMVGVDMSTKAIQNAKELNAYDEVYSLDILDPFYDRFKNHFDYIISSDVFGHIEFGHKDSVIQRLKSLLKEEGTMIHGIETGDIKYNDMSYAQRKEFATVDGHIGMESEEQTTLRFQKQFKNVNTYTPYGIMNDLDEIIKQNESYDVSYLEPELIAYLKQNRTNKLFLDAFNISQFCTHKAYEQNIPLNTFFNLYGFSFLVCSDKTIERYTHKKPQAELQYSQHFYQEENHESRLYRWSQPYSYINLDNISQIELELNSYIPAYTQKEQLVTILVDGKIDKKIRFANDISSVRYIYQNKEKKQNIKLEFYADSSFTPLLFEPNNSDNRILSFRLSIISMEKLS